jgi:hypothetical protein
MIDLRDLFEEVGRSPGNMKWKCRLCGRELKGGTHATGGRRQHATRVHYQILGLEPPERSPTPLSIMSRDEFIERWKRALGVKL